LLKTPIWTLKLHGGVKKDVLTIVDYSQPSTQKRLYVIDLKTDQLLFNTRVAHGKNSGLLYSDQFSNEARSNQSSLGVFVTNDDTYVGHHGTSLRIKGLEEGINDKVASRAVVIHSAWYMGDDFLKTHGYGGRSNGCLAVSKLDINKVIELTVGRSVIFSYAPQEDHDANLTGIKLS
jgi:L,D-transpeptidase-like protein